MSYKDFKMHESTGHTARTGKNVTVKTCERVGGTKPTILHKEVKGRKRKELIFSCLLLRNVTLHTFLKILINIKEISQANSPSRDTDSWCYRGTVPMGLDYQAPTLHQVAPLPSRPAKDTCNCQICLPSSHLHCTLQQEFSVLVIQ